MVQTAQETLWRLIAARGEAGADRDAIDAQIEELFQETWTVVFTDLVGFSRRTRDFGILHFLSLIHQKEQLLLGTIDNHHGRLLKREADSWLLLFRTPSTALEAMLECQLICADHNRGLPKEERIELCVGIGHGSVLRIGDEDVWGREVNLASRLGEDVAQGGETIVTESVHATLASESSRFRFLPVEVPRLSDGFWRVERA